MNINETVTETNKYSKANPKLHQNADLIQEFGTRIQVPLGLDNDVCSQSVTDLNLVLANLMILYDMYRKGHWQTSGQTFYQLHLLFEKHYNEINELIDEVAERVQILGGVSIAMPNEVRALSQIEESPAGREEVPVQLSRFVEAHEVLLRCTREAVKRANENEDEGTSDLLVSGVIRTNEMQVWFIYEHLVSLSPVISNSPET
ncbi:MAG: DNA starvation/stationary phase protection protein [Candidatus Caldatribacteriota bacterium]